MNRHVSHTCVVVALSMWTASARAQDPADVPAVAHPGVVARAVEWAGAKLDGPSAPHDGFYPETGGMIPGAGLSVGPGYRRHLFGDRMIVDASAAVSWRRYSMMQSQLTWPRLAHDRVSLGAQVKFQDFTEINYFGIGRDSALGDQTDYRLRNLDVLGNAAVRARPWLTVTARAGMLRRVDISPGRSTLHPSTTDIFDDRSAPGLVDQPNYVHADVGADVDTRDNPGYPAHGGRYRLSLATFQDRDFARYSFRRVEADAAHYVPLGRTVFALRGRLDVSTAAANQQIPFFMLPTLGGSSSLRGYADYRFRDRDLVQLTAEYRWPLLRALDAAVFYDAGTVAPSIAELRGRPATNYGIGVRAHSATHLIARVDVARGSEGMRALLTFTAPLALSNRTIVPFVP
jgi:outer membrane protein assembly factor BamA